MQFDRDFFKYKSAVGDNILVTLAFGRLKEGDLFTIIGWGCTKQKLWYWYCQAGKRKFKILKDTLHEARKNKKIIDL